MHDVGVALADLLTASAEINPLVSQPQSPLKR